MLNIIKQEYNKLSDLEKTALHIGGQIIFSEVSKIILLFLFFLFFNRQIEFLFAVLILLPLRCNMGGLHFHTYLGCLFATFAIFASSILVLPNLISLNYEMIALLLIACLIINMKYGPVINPTRPTLKPTALTKIRIRVFLLFILYVLFIYQLLPTEYVSYSIWIITEQSLQLILAKIQRNGEIKHEKLKKNNK